MTARSISRSVAGPFARSIVGRLAPFTWTPAALFAQGQQGVWLEASPTYKGQQVLWQQSDGTVIVDANGDPVGRADDLSPNGNNTTQSTSADRPLYQTDGTLHWLGFDGAGDHLRVDSGFIGSLTQNVDVLIAIRRKSTSSLLVIRHPDLADPFIVAIDEGSTASPSSQSGSPVHYVDNAQAVNRGQLHDLTSDLAFHVVEARGVDMITNWTAVQVLDYAGSLFDAPADIAGIVIAEGMTDETRDRAREYLANLAGVTL